MWRCALRIKAGLSLRNWFIGFPDILVVVVMLYLWLNCRSLSLCSPNLFYILLWLLVLSRPLQQLLLRKREKKASAYRSRFTSLLPRWWFILARLPVWVEVFHSLVKGTENLARKYELQGNVRLVFYRFLCLCVLQMCKIKINSK